MFEQADTGYVVCSRQNLPQSTGNPAIQLGAFSPVHSFSTDGYQFFGTEYKITGEAKALQAPQLANEKYQYEMGYVALQSAPTTLAIGHTHHVTFYGVVTAHCPESNVSAHSLSMRSVHCIRRVRLIGQQQPYCQPLLSLKRSRLWVYH